MLWYWFLFVLNSLFDVSPENEAGEVLISGIFESIVRLLILNALQCLRMLMIALILGKTSNQEASPSAGKNKGTVLVPYYAWKCAPTAISSGVNISQVPGCYLYQQVSSQ